MRYMYGVVTSAKTPTVGSFRTAIYYSPPAEIDGLGRFARSFLSEAAADLCAVALALWGEVPLEFIDPKPPFRGGQKRSELRRLTRLIDRERRAAAAERGQEIENRLRDSEAGQSGPAIPRALRLAAAQREQKGAAVDRLVIHDPLDLAPTVGEALDLIRAWIQRGDLRELFCVCNGHWLVKEGVLARSTILEEAMHGPRERPTFAEALELVEECELARHQERVALRAALQEGGRRPGRPRAQIEEATLRRCKESGASYGSIIRAVCSAAAIEGRSISASTVRSRLRSL